MQTTNEELQSANAELQSINDEMRRQTRDLDKANSFLESILSSVNVGVIAIDQQFAVLLWNERAEDMWGLRAGEVKGQALLDLDIGLPVEQLRKPIERFITGKADKKQKLMLNATNCRGQPIKCYITQTIRQDSDSQLEGIVLLMEEERQ